MWDNLGVIIYHEIRWLLYLGEGYSTGTSIPLLFFYSALYAMSNKIIFPLTKARHFG